MTMLDTWQIKIVSTDNRELGACYANREAHRAKIMGLMDWLDFDAANYVATGDIAHYDVYCNGKHYARCVSQWKMHVRCGQPISGALAITPEDLVAVTSVAAKVCTCGCEVVYGKDSGLCVDWCDSRK